MNSNIKPKGISSVHRIHDARLFTPPTSPRDMEILIDGSMTLWRCGLSLDVLAVYHRSFDCFEVVGYNPLLDAEAPRMYLCASAVFKCLDREVTANILSPKKEQALRRHESFDIEKEAMGILMKFASNFITSRINVDRPKALFFNLQLLPQFGDTLLPGVGCDLRQDNAAITDMFLPGQLEDGSAIDTLIRKPDGLEPIITLHFAKFRASVFIRGMGEVKLAMLFSMERRQVAEKLHSIAALAFLQTTKSALKNRSDISLARRRWIWAINKVLHRNLCLKVRQVLDGTDSKQPAATEESPPVIDENDFKLPAQIVQEEAEVFATKRTLFVPLAKALHVVTKSLQQSKSRSNNNFSIDSPRLSSLSRQHSRALSPVGSRPGSRANSSRIKQLQIEDLVLHDGPHYSSPTANSHHQAVLLKPLSAGGASTTPRGRNTLQENKLKTKLLRSATCKSHVHNSKEGESIACCDDRQQEEVTIME